MPAGTRPPTASDDNLEEELFRKKFVAREFARGDTLFMAIGEEGLQGRAVVPEAVWPRFAVGKDQTADIFEIVGRPCRRQV